LLRAIDALKEENLALQHRLAEEVKLARSKDDIETLENFLDSFLNKDMHIALLKSDIRAQEKLSKDDKTCDETPARQQLQRDVVRMCEEFYRLKTAFETRFCIRA
jgi:hypothetical protein